MPKYANICISKWLESSELQPIPTTAYLTFPIGWHTGISNLICPKLNSWSFFQICSLTFFILVYGIYIHPIAPARNWCWPWSLSPSSFLCNLPWNSVNSIFKMFCSLKPSTSLYQHFRDVRNDPIPLTLTQM